MTKNVGMIDRTIRIVAGIALLVWGFVLSEPVNYWGAIGIVPLFTALASWCPAYSLIGMSTKKS